MLGKHVIAELMDCDPRKLDDMAHALSSMESAAVKSGSTVLGVSAHKFEPQGLTVVMLLAESHASLHTWPEKGYAAVDMFTCGNCDPQIACEHMAEALGSKDAHYRVIIRGAGVPPAQEVCYEAVDAVCVR